MSFWQHGGDGLEESKGLVKVVVNIGEEQT